MIGKRAVRSALLGALALGLAACAAPADTPEDRLEFAGRVVEMEIGGGALDKTLDRGAELGLESTAQLLTFELGRELSEDERATVKAVMREALAEFVTRERWMEAVSGVYAENFTVGEIQDVIDFYGSPVGNKILRLQGDLNQEIGDATEGILEDSLEEFIARIDERLGEEFPGLAEAEAGAEP